MPKENRPSPSLNVLCLFLTKNGPIFAQIGSSESGFGTSLFVQCHGPEIFGVHVNHALGGKVSLNAGVGINLDMHVGGNFYFQNKRGRKPSWFGRAQRTLIRQYDVLDGFNPFGAKRGGMPANSSGSQVGLYIPLGYEYIATKGFSIQLDVGPHSVNEDYGQTNTMPLFGSFRIRYTFGKGPIGPK